MWAAGQPTRGNRLEVEHWSPSHNWNVSSRGVVVSQSRYFAPCNASKPAWWAATPGAFSKAFIRMREFVPMTPVSVAFCWEGLEPQMNKDWERKRTEIGRGRERRRRSAGG